MKKIVYIFLILLILFVIVIQFFRPPINNQPVTGDDFFSQLTDTPASIKDILKKSCYDCHSDQTYYPWYGNIAPVSWMLNKHIVEGKEELNFSDWGTMSIRKK